MADLICTSCGKKYPTNYKGYKCDTCGGLLELRFDAKFPMEKIKKRKPTMWRYREAIPIESDENIVSFDEGFTPLLPIVINKITVLVKQDHLFQSGSYKDRGASVLLSHVKEMGVSEIVEDSSGNAGAAIAMYSAKAEVKCEIFVSDETSPAKVSQIAAYGAKIRKIHGSRENVAEAVIPETKEKYYASHCYNPYFFHGTKTFAYEISEQLGWKTPDTVILPVGNGTLLIGAYVGFNDLLKARIVKKIPKFVAVQASNCSPIAKMFFQYSERLPNTKTTQTVAEGIAITKPVRAKQIVDIVRKSGGTFITVEEEEILRALHVYSKKGYYMEPTAAATMAGVQKYVDKMKTNELIVSTITGHGLKHAEKN